MIQKEVADRLCAKPGNKTYGGITVGLSRVRDIVGGRAGGYESALSQAREIALDEMVEKATALGANAVVGIDLDYETINEMLMVCASGTAVVARRK